jgi:tetratricopeptide (TPR) repeat protein
MLLLLTSCGLFTDDDARVARASSALTAGEYRAAIIDLKTVLRNDPQHAQARLLLGQALLRAGDVAGAEKELERAMELGVPVDQLRVSLAWTKAVLGKPSEALALAEINEADTDSDHYQLRMARGIAFVQLGQPADALENFAAADALGIDPIMPLIASAQVHAESGEFVEAQRFLQDALNRVPDSQNALYAMASLSIRRGEPATAEQILQDALDQVSLSNEERALFLELLIETNIIQSDLEGAENLMPELASLRPADDAALRLLRGRLELARTDYPAAIDTLSALVRENPDDLRAQLLLGAAYLARDQLGLADTLIRNVAIVLPDSPEANVLLSELKLRQRGPAATGTPAIEPREIGVTDDADWSMRAEILVNLNQTDEAGEIDITALEDWVRDYPSDAAMRAILANTSLGTGQFEEAREHYEKLIREFPDQPTLLNNLAWVYNELGDPRAADTAARANELMPDNANILDTLGWIQVSIGNPADAIAPLERAYELSDQLPIIGYHLAYAHLASGDPDAAQALIGRLLDDSSTPAGLRTEVEALAERVDKR